MGLLWRSDLRPSSVVDLRDLKRSADHALIRSAMPSAAAKAAEVMLLRTMAILEEYRRVAKEEVGEVERLKREHAVDLRKQEERWQGAAKRYAAEAAKHRKTNIQLTQEVGKLKESLKAVRAEKEELEKDALAREAKLAEKAVGAEFEVTIARQSEKEAEREVGVLGEKLRKAVVEGEAKVAALQAEHERELNRNVEDFEERLADAYAEHDNSVAYYEGEIAQAKCLYEAGFVLGFDWARTQIGLLDPSFDIGLLDQEKIVRDGALIPDPDWGFGEEEVEETVAAEGVGEPVVGEGRQLAEVGVGNAETGAQTGAATTPVKPSEAADGDVPAAADAGESAAEGSRPAEESEQAVVAEDPSTVAAEPDVIDLS